MEEYNYKNIVNFVAVHKTTATNILAELISIADTYGYVLLADYYRMIDVKTDQLDKSYGWTSQSIYEAKVEKSGSGYAISLPAVEILN